MLKDPIHIIDCKRTAIVSANRGLKQFSAAQLAGFVIDGLIEQSKVNKEGICEVILGNAVSAGTGQNLARKAVSLTSHSCVCC